MLSECLNRCFTRITLIPVSTYRNITTKVPVPLVLRNVAVLRVVRACVYVCVCVFNWLTCVCVGGQGSRAPAPAARVRPPTARVPPSEPLRTPPAEPVELRPALRRRVHPARTESPRPAFTAPPARASPAPPGRLNSASAGRSPSPRKISDLDIQLAHGHGGAPAFDRPVGSAPPPPAQRSARDVRLGTLIGNTVESWSRRDVTQHRDPFKPLVFGGTYPIDVPATPEDRPARAPSSLEPEAHRRELRRTIEASLDRFEAMLATRGPRSFDVDAPESAAAAHCARRALDTKYYVAGPKTFDIDEPVPSI